MPAPTHPVSTIRSCNRRPLFTIYLRVQGVIDAYFRMAQLSMVTEVVIKQNQAVNIIELEL